MSAEAVRLVNRAAVVVRPKQSFIDWANHFNDGGPLLNLEDARRHPDVFLVDDLENEPKPEKVLRRYYRTIFKHQLEAWMTDEDTWPLKRDIGRPQIGAAPCKPFRTKEQACSFMVAATRSMFRLALSFKAGDRCPQCERGKVYAQQSPACWCV